MGIIINIDHFTRFGNLKKELSTIETELLSGTEILINSALNLNRGITGNSTAKCCDLNRGNNCKSVLKIKITDIPNELRWLCPECGSEGVIQNWRKSPVYLQSLHGRVKKKKFLNTELTLSRESFLILNNLVSSKLDLSILLNAAEEVDSKIHMYIAEFDILRILEQIALNAVSQPERKNELLSLKNEIINSFYSADKTFN